MNLTTPPNLVVLRGTRTQVHDVRGIYVDLEGVITLKEYSSPSAELIPFEHEIVMGASGCNCIYDGWNNTQNATECTSCEGGLWNAPEIFTNAPDAPNLDPI